jgi:glutamine amidotransferase
MRENYIAIIDYKAGNHTSVHRALAQLKVPAKVTNDFIVLQKALGIIFPGVGAAGQAMEVLRFSGLDHIIRELINAGRPFLGICLGCQIMLEESEENSTRTLGIFSGRNVRFDSARLDEDDRPIRVPHIGWNRVIPTTNFPLWEGIGEEDQFYFVHSYYPVPSPDLVLGTTYHGGTFASVFGRGGVWAVQFHPEKSGKVGLKLLKNFYNFSLAQQ